MRPIIAQTEATEPPPDAGEALDLGLNESSGPVVPFAPGSSEAADVGGSNGPAVDVRQPREERQTAAKNGDAILGDLNPVAPISDKEKGAE